MKTPLSDAIYRRCFFGLCGMVVVALLIWTHLQTPAWDVGIYYAAVRSLAAGHDPYADAMAIQRAFHSQLALHPNDGPPYSYVYSPITLPVLRLVGLLPAWFSAGLYGIAYIAAVIAQLWVTLSAATARERRYFLFVAAVAPFFPGLIASGIVLSGNIAYILYALAFVTALDGWRNGRWRWFYVVALVASCVKAPFLTLFTIPALSARRQWLPAGLTAAAGLALYALQLAIWPDLFHHYLQAVELQFSYNRDFGSSPAGLFCGALFDRGIPYSPGGLIFFAGYALPVLATLFYFSRRFLQGQITLGQWMPLLLLGTVLLNPRIQEYDAAPIAIPLALIGWRFVTAVTSPKRGIIIFAIFFVITNALGLYSWLVWKTTEGTLLALFFIAGAWTLSQTLSRSGDALSESVVLQRGPAIQGGPGC